MAASVYDWSSTAADNATADSDLTWAEGQAPSTVNNSARVMMKRVKDLLVDLGGSITAGGTANALAFSANSGFSLLGNGKVVTFRGAYANTGVATANVNSTGDVTIRKMTFSGESALVGGEIQPGGIYELVYSELLNGGDGGWLLVNPTQSDVPVGSGLEFWGDTAPDGYIFVYGQAISRTTYARLYAVLGTKYGAGDGSTTFNVMDKRGRASFGKDNMGGTSANRLTGLSGGINGDTLGAVGGAETHTLTAAQLAAHTHSVTGTAASAGAHTHGIPTNNVGSGNSDSGPYVGGNSHTYSTDSAGAHTHSVTGTAAANSGGQAHNNVPPGIVCNYIVRY